MSYTSGPEDLQLADYLGVLRRRWWIIALAAVIGAAGGIGYVKTAHKVYTATASVYVAATAGTANQVAGGRTSGAVSLDTQAQVVQSATVAQAAATLMHSSQTVPQLVSRVSVAVPANSQVLEISCQDSSSGGAATCAQSFARAYLDYSTASTTASVKSQLAALQSRIGALESASAKLTVEVASLPANSAQRAAAQEQLTSDHSQLAALNSQVAQLTLALANPSGGSILSAAVPPRSPSSPKAMLIVASGLLVGLLAGLMLAFAADRRNRRIRRPQDVKQADLPVLMSLPLRKFTPELAIAVPRSPSGRDFTELAQVLTGSLGAGDHVVMVTGATAGYGAGLVAANLAVALSRNQPDVTLICANLDGSVIPGLVALPPGPGLTELLADGMLAPAAAPRPVVAPRLRVITPGSATGPEAQDLPLDAVERVLGQLRGTSQWIILEAPAVGSGPDVHTLAHVADTAVLVTEVPRVRTGQLRDRARQLEKMGVPVLGTVLLKSPPAPSAPAAGTPVLEHAAPLALDAGSIPPNQAGAEPADRARAGQASASLRRG